jgi:ankyrin repeat protein
VAWGQNEADTLGRVRDLIAAGAGLEARDRNGRTPLLWAAMQGYAVQLDVRDGVVKALLDAGADAATHDALGRTPLHYAAEQGYGRIVSALLAGGAAVDVKDASGATPLDLAQRRGLTGIVRLLTGAAGGAPTRGAQRTAGMLGPELMSAATRGDLAAVRELLARGADVSYMDSDGFRAIDRARDHGYDDIVAVLKAAEQPAPTR